MKLKTFAAYIMVILVVLMGFSFLDSSFSSIVIQNGNYFSPLASDNNTSIVSSNNTVLNIGYILSGLTLDTLNPLVPAYSDSGINALFYAPFGYVGYPPQSGINGVLLKNWSSSDNYEIWNLTLYSGMKWSNGQPINATDLAWTLDFYNASTLGNGLSPHFAHNVTVINSTTVEVDFVSSNPNFMLTLTNGDYILVYAPNFENIPMSQMMNDSNEANVVSDMPYYIQNYTPGENPIVLTRNSYYGIPGYTYGSLAYKEIDLYLFDSTTTEIAALSDHEISASWVGGSFSSARSYEVPGYTLYRGVPAGEELVQMDYLSYPMNITKVRQALAFATNRSLLAEIGYGNDNYTLLNYATLTSSYDKVFGLTSNEIENYSYNLTLTGEYMRQAGFAMVNGFWTNSSGSPVVLKVIYPDYETESTNIAVELSKEWAAAGFQVELEPLTSTDFTSTQYADPPTYAAAVWQAYGFGLEENTYLTNLYTFWIDYGTTLWATMVNVTYGEIYHYAAPYYVPNGTFGDIWQAYFNASAYPVGSQQNILWNKEVAILISEYVPFIPLYYTYNFESLSNNVYWGNSTNLTGIYNSQGLIQPQFWLGTLAIVHPDLTNTTSGMSALLYVEIGVPIAAIVIGLGGYFAYRRKKSKAEEED